MPYKTPLYSSLCIWFPLNHQPKTKVLIYLKEPFILDIGTYLLFQNTIPLIYTITFLLVLWRAPRKASYVTWSLPWWSSGCRSHTPTPPAGSADRGTAIATWAVNKKHYIITSIMGVKFVFLLDSVTMVDRMQKSEVTARIVEWINGWILHANPLLWVCVSRVSVQCVAGYSQRFKSYED